MNNHPPKLFLRFFRWFCHPRLQKPIEGDLMELYEERVKQVGEKEADRKFRRDVLQLFRPSIIKPADGTYRLNTYGMFKNYFKVGIRNILRNKSHGFINIGGLAIGITVFILISLWIHDEFSFDRNNNNSNRIAKVLKKRTLNGETGVRFSLPIPIVEELRTAYGEDFNYVTVAGWQGESLVDTQEKQLHMEGNFMSDNAPHLLDLKMKTGTKDALKDKFSVILSHQSAKALYGSENPLGQKLTIDGEVTMTVTGTYIDLPYHSSFHGLSFIANFDGYATTQDWIIRAKKNAYWHSNFCQVFVQLADHASFGEVTQKIEKVIYDHLNDRGKENNPSVFLHPMKDWHLRSNWENGEQSGGEVQYVWLFSAIGLFVLLLACINFMNLSTAQAEKRAKEVGIRKSLGSLRSQLITQFLVESVLIVSIAVALSIAVVLVVLPYFNQLAGKQISFPFTEPIFWTAALIFTLVTSVVAASYPAFYLSGFRPVKVLKGSFSPGKASGNLRRSLVVAQFAVSITLIAGTIIVYQQINHSKSRPVGYDPTNLLTVRSSPTAFQGKHSIMRDELLKSGAVKSMSQSSSPLTELNTTYGGFTWEGKDPELVTNFMFSYVTPEFGETVEWNITAGRDFTSQKTDERAFIFNQSAIDFMGLEDPLGKEIGLHGETYRIVGIVADLIIESPFQQAKPAAYAVHMEETQWMQIKLDDQQSTSKAIAKVEQVFNDIMPNVPFGFEFVSRIHGQKFSSVERIGNLSGIFTFLAIFISALGLLGLTSYVVERKTKEIGIRKVLGAEASKIAWSLSWEFGKMVLLASSIAIPLSYFAGYSWLESFAYRIELEWWYFAMAGSIAFVIAGITVSSKTIQAATANPVKSLKDE